VGYRKSPLEIFSMAGSGWSLLHLEQRSKVNRTVNATKTASLGHIIGVYCHKNGARTAYRVPISAVFITLCQWEADARRREKARKKKARG